PTAPNGRVLRRSGRPARESLADHRRWRAARAGPADGTGRSSAARSRPCQPPDKARPPPPCRALGARAPAPPASAPARRSERRRARARLQAVGPRARRPRPRKLSDAVARAGERRAAQVERQMERAHPDAAGVRKRDLERLRAAHPAPQRALAAGDAEHPLELAEQPLLDALRPRASAGIDTNNRAPPGLRARPFLKREDVIEEVRL